MDSPFYIQDGNVYGSEDLDEQLSSVNDLLDEYYFNDHDKFIIYDNKVYQQMRSIDNKDIVIYYTDSEETDIIPCSDNAELFYSNQNRIYYLTNLEFGEIIDGAMHKILDVEYNVAYGYTNVQIIGEYVIIGNGRDNYIYNKDTNSLEAGFSYGIGPYLVNEELIYRFDSDLPPLPKCFEKIGQGYYSLNIEKAIEFYREN